MMLVCTVLMHDIELVHPVSSAQEEPHPAADPAVPKLAAAGSDPFQASLERRGSLRASVRGGWARTGDEHEVMRVEDSGQLMLQVLEHKMLQLAWLPYPSSSLWTLLELVASSYMGVTEEVLLQLLQQALLQDTPPLPQTFRAHRRLGQPSGGSSSLRSCVHCVRTCGQVQRGCMEGKCWPRA